METKERWEESQCQMVNFEAKSYTAGEKCCSLCTEEKLCLLTMNNHKTLNRRSELFAKCRHAEKFHAGRFKSVRNHQTRASAKTVNATSGVNKQP